MRRFLLAALLVIVSGPSAWAQLAPLPMDEGAAGRALALRRVGVTARVLYVTAHPDDENNAVLVALSRMQGLRVALFTLTRGEGGQNEIGPELFDAMGVLRTEELAALHRYDGVEQYFGRAYDFGLSFSVEETFARWGREETLGDVVRMVRVFRPDVILTQPLESAEPGQHHQAAARLAREAFSAAADPTRFPEQIAAGLRPWQARKIYQGGTGGGPPDSGGLSRVSVPIHDVDPVLGETALQIGVLSRSMHRCQSQNLMLAPPGPLPTWSRFSEFALVDAVPPVAGAEIGPLDGIDASVAGLARFVPQGRDVAPPAEGAVVYRLVALQHAFDAARSATAPADVPALLAALRATRETIAALPKDAAWAFDVADRLRDEEGDLERALVRVQGLELRAETSDDLVVPGQSFTVTLRAWSSARPLEGTWDLTPAVPSGWTVEPAPTPADASADRFLQRTFRITVPADAPLTQPYWHRPKGAARYVIDVPADESRPWSPPPVQARLAWTSGGVAVSHVEPVVWRYEDRGAGIEKQKLVDVVPPLSVRVEPAVTVVPVHASEAARSAPLTLRVIVRRDAAGSGAPEVRVEAPAGWTVDPARVALDVRAEGEERTALFRVIPPATLRPGETTLRAVVGEAGRETGEGWQRIVYSHTLERHFFRPATVRVVALDVRVGHEDPVGYVAGAGDETVAALEALGVPAVPLSGDALAFGDLSHFRTIVIGVRAYLKRADLRLAQPRLMEWVRAGGHLVVQYQRGEFNAGVKTDDPKATSPYAPYPAVMTSRRVTDETAPLRVVADSPVLHTPNALGPADWEGWVQERAIQLLETRDPRYRDLLASEDPFPLNTGEKKGMLVEASVGKGTWTYVGLVLYREIPAGVPGAYRLLANLVSR